MVFCQAPLFENGAILLLGAAVLIHVVPSPPRLCSSNRDITSLDTHIILQEGSDN